MVNRKEWHGILLCKNKEYKLLISADMKNDEELVFFINEIPIEIDVECGIYIAEDNHYTEEQLSSLNYYINRYGHIILTDYCLKLYIPIEIYHKQTRSTMTTNMELEMKQDGGNDSKCLVHCVYRLLNAEACVKPGYFDDSLMNLQEQLKDLYIIRTCTTCKFGQGNPEGGDYWNYLCFRKNKVGYLSFPEGVKKTDWEFIIDNRNAEDIRPFFCCKEFEYKE